MGCNSLLQHLRRKIDCHSISHNSASHLYAVVGIERDLARNAAHLLAQDAVLPRGVLRLVVIHDRELLLPLWLAGFPADGYVLRQLGFAAQTAVGRVSSGLL